MYEHTCRKQQKCKITRFKIKVLKMATIATKSTLELFNMLFFAAKDLQWRVKFLDNGRETSEPKKNQHRIRKNIAS